MAVAAQGAELIHLEGIIGAFLAGVAARRANRVWQSRRLLPLYSGCALRSRGCWSRPVCVGGEYCMSTSQPAYPTQRAFVVQIHAEADAAQGEMRGRVEHIVSLSVPVRGAMLVPFPGCGVFGAL